MDSGVPPDRVQPEVPVTRHPDLVVVAGWVLTMGDPVDGVHPVIPDGAVAIADGRIVDVGPARAVVGRAGPAPVRRLPGHVLLPGLVNAHTHLAMTMFRGFADDLDLSAFLERLLPVEAAVLTSDRVRLATTGGRGRVGVGRHHDGARHVLLRRRRAHRRRRSRIAPADGAGLPRCDGARTDGSRARRRVGRGLARPSSGPPGLATGHRPSLDVRRVAGSAPRRRRARDRPRCGLPRPRGRDRGRGRPGPDDARRPTGRGPRVTRASRTPHGDRPRGAPHRRRDRGGRIGRRLGRALSRRRT